MVFTSLHSPSGRLFLVGALVCVAVTGQGESGPLQCSAQTCTNQATDVTGPTLLPLLNHLGVCTLDNQPATAFLSDGAWVKTTMSSLLAQGGQSSLTGQCATRGCSGPTCVTFFTNPRNIANIWLSYYDPNGNPPAANFPLTFSGSPASRQNIDSRIAGTTKGPMGRNVPTEGLWRFRVLGAIYNHQLQHTSYNTSRTATKGQCYELPTGVVRHRHRRTQLSRGAWGDYYRRTAGLRRHDRGGESCR